MKIVTVVMIESASGSPNGCTVRRYTQGEEYNLPENLATVFVTDMKVAKLVQTETEWKNTVKK